MSIVTPPLTGSFTSRCAHVIERLGLAMAGASCGLFVATHMSGAEIELFGSFGMVLGMVVIGALGFYVGIDIPRVFRHRAQSGDELPKTDIVELLSAAGTFLAALAAFTSVYMIVTDPAVGLGWTFTIAGWWMLGVTMQIAAGVIARWRNGHATEAEA
jgi:mannose/fructose/N-acetylgalactosamine-specific phosphotransferase system component IID